MKVKVIDEGHEKDLEEADFLELCSLEWKKKYMEALSNVIYVDKNIIM